MGTATSADVRGSAVRRPVRPSRLRMAALKSVLWIACLTPLGALAGRMAGGGDLGADPVETLLHWTGTTALVLLLVTLAVTPLRRVTRWNPVVRLRRPLGLFAFFYAFLHVGVYLGVDQGLAWSFILEDVVERPYVTAGAAAFLILLSLALTSTRGWIRRLGRRWQQLHRLVYAAGGLALLHFLWGAKADLREPLIYTAAFVGLMLFRVPWDRVRGALAPVRTDTSEGGSVGPTRPGVVPPEIDGTEREGRLAG